MLQITLETPTSRRIQKARTALVLDHPFFGALLFRLKDSECRSIQTMATDGESLYYNPDFVETLNSANLAGTLAHEVMHPALHHHVRRSGRDPKRWNLACDYAINPLLIEAGLNLPEGVLLDNRFRGMSAEQIYNLLDTEAPQDSGSGDEQNEYKGEGSTADREPTANADQPSAPTTEGGIGQVLDAPPPNKETPTIEEQVREWNIAVNQATTVAKHAGKVPAGLNRNLEGAAEAAVDWREFLRRHWSETTPADYSWMRPNRRHLWTGLYLPGVIREGIGEIVIAVDCFGSVSARQLRLFEAEVRSILEGQRPGRVYVLYFDAVVHKVETYEAGQRIDLNPRRRRNRIWSVLRMDQRERHPASDPGLSDRPVWFIPTIRSRVSRPVDFDREPEGAIRRRHSYAGCLVNMSHHDYREEPNVRRQTDECSCSGISIGPTLWTFTNKPFQGQNLLSLTGLLDSSGARSLLATTEIRCISLLHISIIPA